MGRLALAALVLLLAAEAGVRAQPDVAALVAKAGAYVEAFQRDFGSVVAEERYDQALRPAPGAAGRILRGGSGPTRVVLVSDFLLVQVPGEGWLPFRDVFEHDGRQVRDREERLARVFLSGARDAFAQARAIMAEGARYNIGNVTRNINVPTLPLPFVTAEHRHRFRFTLAKADRAAEGVVVAFRETARPTFVSTTGGRDLPVAGRLWIDADDGTIYRTELTATDTDIDMDLQVAYAHDAGLGLWVPARMDERLVRRNDPMQVIGIATYSRFRRFQVRTSEEVKSEK